MELDTPLIIGAFTVLSGAIAVLFNRVAESNTKCEKEREDWAKDRKKLNDEIIEVYKKLVTFSEEVGFLRGYVQRKDEEA